jgi:hypothetical protein
MKTTSQDQALLLAVCGRSRTVVISTHSFDAATVISSGFLFSAL